MIESITNRVEAFLRDNEVVSFTKLIGDPTRLDQYDSHQEYIEALSHKENLLSQAFTLLKSLLSEHDLTDHTFRKDTEDMQEEITKTLVLHNTEQSQMKTILAEHYTKESLIQRHLIESNEELERVLAMNEQKELECQTLKAALSELNESFEQRVSFCNQVTNQLQQLHNDYCKLSEFNELKLQELAVSSTNNEKLIIQLRECEREVIMLQIDNQELAQQILRLRDVETYQGRNIMYEAMAARAQIPDNHEADKQNVQTLNIPIIDHHSGYCSGGGFCSPRNVSSLGTKQIGSNLASISYKKEQLNELHILKSGGNYPSSRTSGMQVVNIEDKLLKYLTPIHRTDITDFQQCKIQIQTDFEQVRVRNTSVDETSPPPDPYNCFFMLLVQCAKLNHPRFELTTEIGLDDLWVKFLNEMIPMNKWAKLIDKELEKRLISKNSMKRSSVVGIQ